MRAKVGEVHARVEPTFVATGRNADVFRIALKKIGDHHANVFILFFVSGAHETEMITTRS